MWWQPWLVMVLGPLIVFSLWVPWEIYKTRWHYWYLKERRTKRFRKMELSSPYDSHFVQTVDAGFDAAYKASLRHHDH